MRSSRYGKELAPGLLRGVLAWCRAPGGACVFGACARSPLYGVVDCSRARARACTRTSMCGVVRGSRAPQWSVRVYGSRYGVGLQADRCSLARAHLHAQLQVRLSRQLQGSSVECRRGVGLQVRCRAPGGVSLFGACAHSSRCGVVNSLKAPQWSPGVV